MSFGQMEAEVASSTEVRLQARLDWAARFFEEEFVPAISEKRQLSRCEIEELLTQFRRGEPDSVTFTLDHVWGIAWRCFLQLEQVAADNPKELPANASCYVQAYDTLSALYC